MPPLNFFSWRVSPKNKGFPLGLSSPACSWSLTIIRTRFITIRSTFWLLLSTAATIKKAKIYGSQSMKEHTSQIGDPANFSSTRGRNQRAQCCTQGRIQTKKVCHHTARLSPCQIGTDPREDLRPGPRRPALR